MSRPLTIIETGWTLWSLLELFVNMDLARMSELNVDKCMNAFQAPPWNMGVDRPGDISYGMLPSMFTFKLLFIVHQTSTTCSHGIWRVCCTCRLLRTQMDTTGLGEKLYA